MTHDQLQLIISCEHASAHISTDYLPVFFDAPEIFTTHAAYDIGALTVAKQCATMASFTCYASISRLLIDFNRSLHHKGIFSKWSKRLSPLDRDALIDNYYRPYRQNLIKHIEQAIAQDKKILHISVHSFTPILNDILRNAEIGLLYDPKRPSEVAWVKSWQDKLQKIIPNCRIRRNYPYRGVSDGLTTSLRKQFPDNQYMGFELEINQALLGDAVAQQNVAQSIYQSLRALL